MSTRQIILWVVLAFLAFPFGGPFLVLILLLALSPALVMIKAANAPDHVAKWMGLALISIIVFACFPILLIRAAFR